MKNKFTLVVTFLVLGINLQAQVLLSEYRTSQSVAVSMPVQGDSVNLKGARFGINELLKTPISLNLKEQETQILPVDSTGFVSLSKADKGNLFYLLETNLQAERFTHATLKMFSSVRFEVFVNGQMKQSNSIASDTITQIRPVTINLRMEPRTNYNVVIKILSTSDDKMKPMLKCELDNGKNFKNVSLYAGPELKRHLSLFDTAFGAKVTSLSLSEASRPNSAPRCGCFRGCGKKTSGYRTGRGDQGAGSIGQAPAGHLPGYADAF